MNPNCYRVMCALEGMCLTEHWDRFRLIRSNIEPMIWAG